MTNYTPKKVVTAYTLLSGTFTLAASLIWAINTVFLIRLGGLSLFEVMLVNAIFTVGQMVFEVPTGVVADTIGRKASLLLSMVTLIVSTMLYVLTPRFGWGFAGFALAGAIIGLGYTFQTGAIDAWLVDALDATGFVGPKDPVFARGQIAGGAGMLFGSLAGGLLGQVDLVLPYVVRAVLIAVCFVIVLLMVRDEGFEKRPLHLGNFAAETRRIFDAGVRFGWRSRVIRPMMWVSALGGVFFFYGFYAWQPYVLELLGDESMVWVLGVAQAAFSAAGIAGNVLVGRLAGRSGVPRDSARILEWCAWGNAAIALAIAAVGFSGLASGWIPAGIAIALWVGYGLIFGIAGPVRMAFINEHIPGSERATVLSLDAFFGDAGGAVGQPALGWLSDRYSIKVAWALGSLALLAVAPLYQVAGRAAREAGKKGSRVL